MRMTFATIATMALLHHGGAGVAPAQVTKPNPTPVPIPVPVPLVYPNGYGPYGWHGWTPGGGTVQGDIARGMGVYAAGAGVYNEKSAVANSVNADTVMRWNQYMYQSQVEANRRHREMAARRRADKAKARAAIDDRLRNNPEPRDIQSGDALNVVLDEINDPRVYPRALQAAKLRIGGESIRVIPFHYAAEAISLSIDQMSNTKPPAVFESPAFEDIRKSFKPLNDQIAREVEADQTPDPTALRKMIEILDAARARARTTIGDTRQRQEADKYLKTLRALVAMLTTPSLEVVLAGVEKRPDAELGELLTFMNAFNFRFGSATTPAQREVYSRLYPMLVKLRDQAGIPPAASAAPAPVGQAPVEFFSGINDQDLQKKDPAPPRPAGPK